jgi:hypothetical protein
MTDNQPVSGNADSPSETAEGIIITNPASYKPIITKVFLIILSVALIYVAGIGSGYLVWGRNKPTPDTTKTTNQAETPNPIVAIANAVNPQDGFKIQAKYGDAGPILISAGVIDRNAFEKLYLDAGQPLSDKEIEILTKGSQDQVIINSRNAHFMLNFFWALGLANKNPILLKGPIQQASGGQIDGLISTGGWTIGQKAVTELFSSTPILSLTDEQQARLEEVAKAVYRPCCNNPTHFPDCNHGMAMLGLLELMASQNASTDEMFNAAKYVNAFWFPQQTLEQAVFFKYTQKLDYADIDPRQIVDLEYSSGSGFQQMHQWLANNGLLPQAPQNGNNCGV